MRVCVILYNRKMFVEEKCLVCRGRMFVGKENWLKRRISRRRKLGENQFQPGRIERYEKCTGEEVQLRNGVLAGNGEAEVSSLGTAGIPDERRMNVCRKQAPHKFARVPRVVGNQRDDG